MSNQVVLTVPDPLSAHTNNLNDLVPTLTPSVDGRQVGFTTKEYFTRWKDNEFKQSVRRPLSGLHIKPNTHAYVQVLSVKDGSIQKVFNDIGASFQDGDAGNSATMLDSGKTNLDGPISQQWTDWLLQNVSESRNEKVQIVETFGAPMFYAFGERPRILTFQGILLNTVNFPWEMEFWENWDKYFRATKLVEQGNQLRIVFDDIVVTGYPLGANARKSSANPNSISFGFQFLITSYVNVTANRIGVLQRARYEYHIPGIGEYFSKVRATDNAFGGSGYAEGYFGTDQESVDRRAAISNIIGGNRLQFFEHLKGFFDLKAKAGAIPGLSALTDIDGLSYIRGSKTAVDFLSKHLRLEHIKWSRLGTTELAKITPGGIQGLNYWFGNVGTLYFGIFSKLGVDTTGDGQRWERWAENLTRIGNPYRVVQDLSYAPIGLGLSALYSQTEQFSERSVEWSAKLGTVSTVPTTNAEKQNAGVDAWNAGVYAAPLKKDTLNLPNAKKASEAAPPLFIAKQKGPAATSLWGELEGADDPETDTDAQGPQDKANQTVQYKKAQEEAAMKQQLTEKYGNHGAITVLDDDDEILDDGTEDISTDPIT